MISKIIQTKQMKIPATQTEQHKFITKSTRVFISGIIYPYSYFLLQQASSIILTKVIKPKQTIAAMFSLFPNEVFERYCIRTTIVRMFQKPSRIITNAAVALSQILFPYNPKMSQTKQLIIPTKLHKLTIKSVIVFSLLYCDIC